MSLLSDNICKRLKKQYLVRRFLSQCKSLWYFFLSRVVPCFTVIDCRVSCLCPLNDELIIYFWWRSRVESVWGESCSKLGWTAPIEKTQNILRNFTRNLFIPVDICIIISLNVAVENNFLSCRNCVDSGRLGHNYCCINICQQTQKNTWVKRFQPENMKYKRNQKNILQVRAVMRVQRVPSMLSVCAENGLVTWKVSLLLTDERVWRMRRGGAGGAI